MKIQIDLEGLEAIIKDSAKKNTEESIDDAIKEVAHTYIENNFKQKIEEAVNNAIENHINQYLATAEITVGNPFDGESVVKYTPDQYINMKIGEVFKDNCFTIKEKDPYYRGGYKEKKVSFEDYIKKEFNYTSLIESEMKKFISNFKKELSNYFKETYTREMEKTLCSSVVDVIMQDDNFKKINDKISRLCE